METIDLQASIDKSDGRINKTFIARTLGRPTQTILNWCKGQPIPKEANRRLISLFRENGVEPEFVK